LRIHHGQLVFSATDLVNFLGCRHASYLDRRQLDDPMPIAPPDPLLELLQAKGMQHERQHLESLRARGKGIVEIEATGSLIDRVAKTRAAMASGAEVIYQGALLDGQWHGYADFLVKVPGTSKLGPYLYEPVDTKLSLTAKPKHAIQLAVYARLLAAEQGVAPPTMHIVLGTTRSQPFVWPTSITTSMPRGSAWRISCARCRPPPRANPAVTARSAGGATAASGLGRAR